jgi:hypothetical protein
MESKKQSIDVVQLANVLGNKYTRSFIITTNKSDITVTLPQPLQLDKRLFYTLKLRSFNGWQSVININEKNNTFTYGYPVYESDRFVTTNWETIKLSRGLYSVKQINDILHVIMKEKGHYDSVNNKYYINFGVDENQNKCFVQLSNNYHVNFSLSDINLIFGFNKALYSDQDVKIFAPNVSKISNSLEMLIYCDLVEPNIFIDTKGHVQYLQHLASFPLYLSEANTRLTIRDSDPDKYRIIKSKYNNYEFRVKLLNEHLELLDFNGETSVITLVLESC